MWKLYCKSQDARFGYSRQSSQRNRYVMISLSSDDNDRKCTNRHSAVGDDEDAMMVKENIQTIKQFCGCIIRKERILPIINK